MKKLYGLLIATTIASVPVMAQNEISCNYVNLSGEITENRTLYADTIYRLDGCVRVTDDAELTIQAGTMIIGRKNTNKGGLLIDRGAKLIAVGNAMNRIIFTSDQTPGNKLPGDWLGIVIAGNDYTNASGGTISLGNEGCMITGGGELEDDNSGELKFVNIDFAQNALTLLCVGRETEIDYVKAGNAANNSFQLRGGSVPLSHPISVDPTGHDFLYSDGNLSFSQFGLSVRLDASAYVSGSSAVVIQNDGAGSSNMPYTHPVLSNYTLMGPWSCGGSPSTDFEHAVVFLDETEGEIHNSVIRGWQFGVGLYDNGVANATTGGTIIFGNNTLFENVNIGIENNWSVLCATDIDDWVLGGSLCSQVDNEDLLSGLGYNANICTNYPYSSSAPTWSVTSTSMLSPDYSASSLTDDYFANPDNRGAFDATDWTGNWVIWYSQGYNVCPQLRKTITTGVANLESHQDIQLQIAPNPVSGMTNAIFNAEKTGIVQVVVMNSVGQVVRSMDITVSTAGTQKVAINTEGLSSGMYIVNLSLGEHEKAHAKLMVK